MFGMEMAPRFTEEEARNAIAESRSWAESLRRLDYCPTGSNPATLKKWARRWGISTDHFDAAAVRNETLRRQVKQAPLEEVPRRRLNIRPLQPQETAL